MPKITFWPCAGDKAPPVELINELVESNPIQELHCSQNYKAKTNKILDATIETSCKKTK